MTLRIEIDPERCMGSGNCSFWAPATFDLGDDGVAFVLASDGDAPGDDEEKVLLAAQGCPTQAIAVWRGEDRIA